MAKYVPLLEQYGCELLSPPTAIPVKFRMPGGGPIAELAARRRVQGRRRSPRPIAMARLPEIKSRDELPEESREIFDYIEKTRGGVHLPYSVFLHLPELAYRKLHVGSYVRFETTLPRNVSELAICTAAREFDCRFEWAAHAGAASRVGVSAEAVDVIAYKRELDGLSDEEALPVRFTRELLRDHRVQRGNVRGGDGALRPARRHRAGRDGGLLRHVGVLDEPDGDRPAGGPARSYRSIDP